MTLALHPRATACGKVILLGEHAVVHGYPALAAGLGEGVVLEAEAADDRHAFITLQIPSWGIDLELRPENEHPVARACLEVLTRCDGPVTGWRIRGLSRLPSRAGLGSSAALTVAMARLALGQDAPSADVVAASLVGERVFHGEPSGIDSHVAATGGVLRFTKGEPPEPVALPGPLPLVIIPSNVPRSTADQVAKVRDKLERLPAVVRPTLDALGGAVNEGQIALERGDSMRLGEIMNMAHALLSAMGVSSPVLDELCAVARATGALGAKLTGAGGGGCVIALPPADGLGSWDEFSNRQIEPLHVEVAP